MMVTDLLDVSLAELERDPYPTYARLRREAPVAFIPAAERWLITRRDDCEAAGKDPAFLPSHRNDAFFGAPNILSLSGEPHVALRKAVDPHYRPRVVAGYIEELARPVARRRIEELREHGRADLTADLFERVSVRVVGDLLGMCDVDDETLQRWFHALSDGLANLAGDPEPERVADRAKFELGEHVRATVGRVTSTPDDSGISHMVWDGADGGEPRTYESLIGTIRVIILGGLQEPGDGAANSVLGLLENPEQLAAVRTEPDELVPRVVLEGLRWIAPFGLTERYTATEVTVAGVTIPAGAEIGLVLASANRDETKFEDPDSFDVYRSKPVHAAFGYGAHFCSGHFLSRRLEEIMVDEAVRSLPRLRLDPDAQPRVHGFTMRAVKRLPVIWG
jgi:cytochrome P450